MLHVIRIVATPAIHLTDLFLPFWLLDLIGKLNPLDAM